MPQSSTPPLHGPWQAATFHSPCLLLLYHPTHLGCALAAAPPLGKQPPPRRLRLLLFLGHRQLEAACRQRGAALQAGDGCRTGHELGHAGSLLPRAGTQCALRPVHTSGAPGKAPLPAFPPRSPCPQLPHSLSPQCQAGTPPRPAVGTERQGSTVGGRQGDKRAAASQLTRHCLQGCKRKRRSCRQRQSCRLRVPQSARRVPIHASKQQHAPPAWQG